MAEKETPNPEQVLKEKNLQKRAELKAKTAKQGGDALYRVAHAPHYRHGVMHPIGTVVRIPVEEEPSITWEAVNASELGPSAAQVEPPNGSTPAQTQTHDKKRPSDKSL